MKTFKSVIDTNVNKRDMQDLTMYLEFQATQYRRGLLTVGQMLDQLAEFHNLYVLRILEEERRQVRDARGW